MSEPKSRPILFSGAMVRAILAGTKTQTRRVVKPQPSTDLNALYNGNSQGPIICHDLIDDEGKSLNAFGVADGYFSSPIKCPYGKPGQRLWVKETWQNLGMGVQAYRADHGDEWDRYDMPEPCSDELVAELCQGWKWKSPRFMPRWASRIELEIVSVRVERLNDISEADALAEGVLDELPCRIPNPCKPSRTIGWGRYKVTPLESYKELWESINGKGSWAVNPWVWVIEFRRVNP